jgi:ADP-ribose pyrophosphatase YjhB (NUDIX family)
MSAPTSLIVSAIVRRDDRLLLVEQQGPEDPDPSWMLPGGRVEPAETLVTALVRELAEETGLELVGLPRIAFAVDLMLEAGHHSAISFACEAAGTVAPSDPDGFVRSAAWIDTDEGIERLRRVEWYDCAPLERFLSGDAVGGAMYVVDRT